MHGPGNEIKTVAVAFALGGDALAEVLHWVALKAAPGVGHFDGPDWLAARDADAHAPFFGFVHGIHSVVEEVPDDGEQGLAERSVRDFVGMGIGLHVEFNAEFSCAGNLALEERRENLILDQAGNATVMHFIGNAQLFDVALELGVLLVLHESVDDVQRVAVVVGSNPQGFDPLFGSGQLFGKLHHVA